MEDARNGDRKTSEEAAAIVQMKDRGDLNQGQQGRRKAGSKREAGGRMDRLAGCGGRGEKRKDSR